MKETLLKWVMACGGITDRLKLDRIVDGQIVRVIDAGARYGFHPRWNQLGAGLRIVMFEPDPLAFNELQELYQSDGRVSNHNVALADRDRYIQIYFTARGDSSSLYKPDAAFFARRDGAEAHRIERTVVIPARSISSVVPERIDFVKLDVEGFELEVLKGITPTALDSLIGIEAEVSFVKWATDLPLFADVDAFCRSHGFVLNNLVDGARFHYDLPDARLSTQGFVMMGDALYWRSPEEVVSRIINGRWDQSFLNRVLALYLVYGNCEFAYVLLRKAVEAGLIGESDVLMTHGMARIRDRSGYRKRLSYRVIRYLKRVLRVPLGLDF